jgi:hypothetical protein
MIFIHFGSWILNRGSLIPDPSIAAEEKVKKIICPTFVKGIYVKNSYFHLAVTNIVWDPRSGKEPSPDPGSRGQKVTRSRIRIRNTAFRIKYRTVTMF